MECDNYDNINWYHEWIWKDMVRLCMPIEERLVICHYIYHLPYININHTNCSIILSREACTCVCKTFWHYCCIFFLHISLWFHKFNNFKFLNNISEPIQLITFAYYHFKDFLWFKTFYHYKFLHNGLQKWTKPFS